MIELSNTIAQVVEPGASITFNVINRHTGNAESCCSSSNNTTIPLSAIRMKSNGTYILNFNANIRTATGTGEAAVSASVGGNILPQSRSAVTTGTAGDWNNVSFSIPISRDCCCDKVSIVNSGTVAISIAAYPDLNIRRIS